MPNITTDCAKKCCGVNDHTIDPRRHWTSFGSASPLFYVCIYGYGFEKITPPQGRGISVGIY